MTGSDSLLDFVSHIDGKNAQVRIHLDRVEWSRDGKVSAGKAALGMATGGISLLKTGVRSAKGSSEMIPVRALTSVTVERDGFRQMKVRLIASGNTIDMRVSKDEADRIKNLLTSLMVGNHPIQIHVDTPSASTATQELDVADQIRKLAELRDAGVLSAEEFETKKRDLLGRL